MDLLLATRNAHKTREIRQVLGPAFTVSDIPFPETRAYVTKVLTAEREYRSKYASQLYG